MKRTFTFRSYDHKSESLLVNKCVSDRETVCALKTLDKKQIFEQSFRLKVSKQGGLRNVPPARQKQEAELGVCLWVWFYSMYMYMYVDGFVT